MKLDLLFFLCLCLFLCILLSRFSKRPAVCFGRGQEIRGSASGFIFALMTISNLDHYPFSLYQGQFLFFFLSAFGERFYFA